ncbi:UNKNOWN [Stylonychia lemnae]|uniref:Uncharacterized protein n=1 Tax=Stylonychia lemnae TaxID=5949 RepID=A0A078A2V1_STYLE|nr:UNKNOWN [Stylonychia lemnae]|eukprot:CDW75099.1 UNKNOWN [Stylonychia lemnae]
MDNVNVCILRFCSNQNYQGVENTAAVVIQLTVANYARRKFNQSLGMHLQALIHQLHFGDPLEFVKIYPQTVVSIMRNNFILAKYSLTGNTGQCMEPINDKSCEICQSGFDEFLLSGNNICGDCQSQTGFYSEGIRCNLNSLTTVQAITGCQYGLATYNRRGTLESSYCVACNPTCFECASNGDCLICKLTYYLSTRGFRDRSYGICLKKNSLALTDKIYVNSLNSQNLNPVNTINGSYSNAYNTIQDAITRANELGAPYFIASITIILKLGTHAMLPVDKPIYQPIFQDITSGATILIFDTEDGSIIKVNYKLGDKWTFQIQRGITMNNLHFDAIDSILSHEDDSTGCLSNGLTSCCQTDYNIKDIIPKRTCILKEKPQFNFYLIFSVQKIATLQEEGAHYSNLIINCIFENFIYDFNSFIEINNKVGYITITNSQFINFNTCGSIVRNKKVYFNRTDITPNSFENAYLFRTNNFQYQASMTLENELAPYYPFGITICNLTNPFSRPCLNLIIQGSSFRNFGFLKVKRTSPLWVDPKYKMQFNGMIVDLEEFKGHIQILNNSFKDNHVKYQTCDVGRQIKNMDKSQFVDNFPSYGNKSVIQLKSLISITKFDYILDIIENTFEQNSGTRGLINLDLKHRAQRAIIAKNLFFRNFGYYDTNVLFIRGRGMPNTSIYTALPDNNTIFCGGYLIDSNNFTQNAGCVLYSGGSVSMQCVNDNATYITSNDQYAIGSIAAMKQKYLVSYNFLNAPSTTYLYNKITYSVNFRHTLIQNNNYIQSTVSGGKALVDITSFPRLIIFNEYYAHDGDASVEFNEYVQHKEYNSRLALLKIGKINYLNIRNISFYMTWILETINYDSNRSQAIHLNFVGASILFTDDRSNGIANPLIRVDPGDQALMYYTSTANQFTYLTTMFYYVHPQNVNQSQNIFPNFSDPNGIYATTVNIQRHTFGWWICWYCIKPMLEFQTDQMVIRQTFIYEHNTFYTASSAYGTGVIFKFYIKKPYLSGDTLITPTLTIDNFRVEKLYTGKNSRLIDISYLQKENDIEPTSFQVYLWNLIGTNVYALGDGSFLRLDVDSIQVQIIKANFTYNYARYLMSQTGFGGSIYIQSAGVLLIDQLYATDLFAPHLMDSKVGGGGRLLYSANTEDNFTFTAFISQNKYDQGSVITLNGTGLISSVTVYNSRFQDCARSQSGASLRVENKGITILTLQNNYFGNMNSLVGGAVFCKNCRILNISQNTFDDGFATQAIDIYLVDPIGPILLDQNYHNGNTNPRAFLSLPGGSIRIIDTITSTLDYQESLQINLLSSNKDINNGSFQNYKASQGAILSVKANRLVTINVDNTQFSNIYSNSISGMFHLDLSLAQQILFNMSNSNISVLNSTSGAILYIPSQHSSATILIESCIINQVTVTTGSGGLFNILSQGQNLIDISNTQITQISSGSNGILYQKWRSSLYVWK